MLSRAGLSPRRPRHCGDAKHRAGGACGAADGGGDEGFDVGTPGTPGWRDPWHSHGHHVILYGKSMENLWVCLKIG